MIPVWELAELETTVPVSRGDNHSSTFHLWTGVESYPHQLGFDYDAQDRYMERMAPAVNELNLVLKARYPAPTWEDICNGDFLDPEKVINVASTIGLPYFTGDATWLQHIVRHGEIDEETEDEGPGIILGVMTDAWLHKHGTTFCTTWGPAYGREYLDVTFNFDGQQPLHEIDQLEAQVRQTLTALWTSLVAKYHL